LATLLGYELPAATTMRDFLETFHMDTPRLWRAGEKAAIPEESGVLGSKKWTPSTYDLGSGGVRWNNYRDSNIRRSSGSKRCGWSWNERVRLTV
jgi:hypothetical protein